MAMRTRSLASFTFLALALGALLAVPGRADAAGGTYVFDGGDRKARAQVRAALDASAFPWDVVPVPVTIHIGRRVRPHATPGDIWLDPRLLAAGRFSWGIVQHEYAHQVAFFLFGKKERARLARFFGARAWCYERAELHHDGQACERFASALAWAYWPSPHNVARPHGRTHGLSSAASPRVRRLAADLLGPPAVRANTRLVKTLRAARARSRA